MPVPPNTPSLGQALNNLDNALSAQGVSQAAAKARVAHDALPLTDTLRVQKTNNGFVVIYTDVFGMAREDRFQFPRDTQVASSPGGLARLITEWALRHFPAPPNPLTMPYGGGVGVGLVSNPGPAPDPYAAFARASGWSVGDHD